MRNGGWTAVGSSAEDMGSFRRRTNPGGHGMCRRYAEGMQRAYRGPVGGHAE